MNSSMKPAGQLKQTPISSISVRACLYQYRRAQVYICESVNKEINSIGSSLPGVTDHGDCGECGNIDLVSVEQIFVVAMMSLDVGVDGRCYVVMTSNVCCVTSNVCCVTSYRCRIEDVL